MTEDQLKAALDRVLTWPPERQEDAVQLLASMEMQDSSGYGLSDDQVEEINRRRADRNADSLTLDAFNQHVQRRLDE